MIRKADPDLPQQQNNTTANNVVKGGILLFAESIFIRSFDFLTGILLLRFLGPTDYGIYTIGLSIVMLATMFTGQAETNLERFIPQWQAEQRFGSVRRLFLVVSTVNLVLASAVILVIWILSGWLAQYFQISALESVIKLLLVLVLSNNFANTASYTLMGLFAYRLRVTLLLLRSVTYLVYTAVILWVGATLVGVIFGFTLLSLLFASIIYGITGKTLWKTTAQITIENEPTPFLQILSTVVHYALPLSGGYTLHMVYNRMGTLLSGFLFGPAAAAYFGLAMMIYETVTQALVSLFRALLATMSHLWGTGQQVQAVQLFIHSFRYATVCGGVFSSLLILSARPLILLLGGDTYLPAVILLQILAVQLIIRLPYEVITVIYYLNQLTWRILGYNLVKTGVDFLGYVLFIPLLGLTGAATAHIFSYVAALFIYMFRLPVLPNFGVSMMTKMIIRTLVLFPVIVIPLFYAQLYIINGSWFNSALMIVLVPVLWITGGAVSGLITPFDADQLKQVTLPIVWTNRVKDILLETMRYYLTWIIQITPVKLKTL